MTRNQGVRTPWLSTRARYAAAFLMASVIGLVLVYKGKLNGPPIRSDGEGYYMYLPALLVDRDLTLHTLAHRRFDGQIPTWTGAILHPSSGAYVIKYPAGEAVLLAPFFILAAGLAHLQSAPVDGYSRPFQYLAALAGPLYATIGVFMLWGSLRRRFRTPVVAAALSSVVFGTNLYHYVTYDSVFSHAFSFFLVCALISTTEAVYRSGRWTGFVNTGLVMGMLILTRPTNALWIIVPLMFGLTNLQSVRERLTFWRTHARSLCAAGIAGTAVMVIQLVYWKHVTGHWVVYSYGLGNEHFNFLRPEIANVLFSVHKGLFFWSPLWLLGMLGLWQVKQRAPEFFWPIVMFLPLSTWVIASWHCWWYGGSFGSRPYVEAAPLLCVCLAALLEAAYGRRARLALSMLLGASLVWSVWMMSKYWRGDLSMEHPTPDAVLETVQHL